MTETETIKDSSMMEEDTLSTIRSTDNPKYKESVIAQLHGEFLGFLNARGLTKGDEYESQTHEILSCSKRYIHIFDQDKMRRCQLVVVLNSIAFSVEFGVYDKKAKKVLYRNKLENLRYKISTDTEIELIDSHQVKFREFFDDFKGKFEEIFKNGCLNEKDRKAN